MKSRTTALVVLSFVAFVSLGLPDGLLGVAWPTIRREFGLPVDALGLFLIFATAGYMTSSFASGALVRRLGLGTLLAASCAATGVALGAYSVAPSWWLFVGFALLGGAGAGAIDAGLNNYIASNHSERLMQWLHASFGVGITLGPAIMTTSLAVVGHWQPGYRIVSLAQLVLALAFLVTRRLWERSTAAAASGSTLSSGDPVEAAALPHDDGVSAKDGARVEEAPLGQSVLHLPSLLGMLIFFTYTGAELGVGTWTYTLLTESRGVAPTIAGIVTGSYWASFTVGRILAGVFGARIGLKRLVGGSIVLAAAGVLLVLLNFGPGPTVVGVALTGFVIAPVFPGLMSDTRGRVEERHHSNTVGMQIAGAGLGGAVLPSIAGVLARAYGLEAIPVFLFCVLVALLLLFLASHVVRLVSVK